MSIRPETAGSRGIDFFLSIFICYSVSAYLKWIPFSSYLEIRADFGAACQTKLRRSRRVRHPIRLSIFI